MKDKVVVFYNNKTFEVITTLIPNDSDIDLEDFRVSRIEYDEHCKEMELDDLSYSVGSLDEYNRLSALYSNAGNISIDKKTRQIVITGEVLDSITFSDIQNTYEFHIEYNTKALESIYKLEYLRAEDIYVDEITYSDAIRNPEINNYFDNRTIDDLAEDIKRNGMYFPFFGYYKDDRFIAIEGTHRAKAVQKIGGEYLCISKRDGSMFDVENSEPIESLYMYEYVGGYTFEKRQLNSINAPASKYISNNILMSNELLGLKNRVPSFFLVNNKTDFKRIISTDFIRKNRNYYSLNISEVQSLYDKYVLNKSLFDIKLLNISDIKIEELPSKNLGILKTLDPYLASMEKKELKDDLMSNGMMYPFIVYIKDGEYYVAEGYHRYQALRESNIDCSIECIVYDLEKIYYRYPSYIEDKEYEIYIPRNIFPYQEYPYVPNLYGFHILEEDDYWYKIKVSNDIQLIQAYKLLPMVLKHMTNYIWLRYGKRITYDSCIRSAI